MDSVEGTLAPPPTQMDILNVVEPSAQMKAEMRMATKTPSEWLRLLCRDYSLENEAIVSATDLRFYQYKPYLKGLVTSQLLCRLSISGGEGGQEMASAYTSFDFWRVLGIEDEFDRAHIVANIERFCSLYNIRGGTLEEMPPAISPTATNNPPNYFADAWHDHATAAAAAAVAGMSGCTNYGLLFPADNHAASMATSMSTKTMAGEPKSRSEQRRLKAEHREREREAYAVRKAAEKAARLATREERKQRKLAMRRQREEHAQQQKEAALRRAAELVQSNRVPIELTGGGFAAHAAAGMPMAPQVAATDALGYAAANPTIPTKKGRSSIVISTASDLDQIVTHANNLWAKYNAIAKEHNQKVNWIVVAKELGIHVKVREKYARMHARALARGFDFVNWGHYRIKDYPQYFLDPLGPSSFPEQAPALDPAPVQVPAKMEELGKQAAGAAPQMQQMSMPPIEGVPAAPHQNPLSIVAETAEVLGDNPTYVGNSAVVEATGAEVPGNEGGKMGGRDSVDSATMQSVDAGVPVDGERKMGDAIV